mmetsp:Transcript_20757/g.54144  ORF Transcript_20757/g.54144 Transcript_20757/m.54144 type:complete len:244 (-) Transcript_20757:2355-3086(-)
MLLQLMQAQKALEGMDLTDRHKGEGSLWGCPRKHRPSSSSSCSTTTTNNNNRNSSSKSRSPSKLNTKGTISSILTIISSTCSRAFPSSLRCPTVCRTSGQPCPASTAWAHCLSWTGHANRQKQRLLLQLLLHPKRSNRARLPAKGAPFCLMALLAGGGRSHKRPCPSSARAWLRQWTCLYFLMSKQPPLPRLPLTSHSLASFIGCSPGRPPVSTQRLEVWPCWVSPSTCSWPAKPAGCTLMCG